MITLKELNLGDATWYQRGLLAMGHERFARAFNKKQMECPRIPYYFEQAQRKYLGMYEETLDRIMDAVAFGESHVLPCPYPEEERPYRILTMREYLDEQKRKPPVEHTTPEVKQDEWKHLPEHDAFWRVRDGEIEMCLADLEGKPLAGNGWGVAKLNSIDPRIAADYQNEIAMQIIKMDDEL